MQLQTFADQFVQVKGDVGSLRQKMTKRCARVRQIMAVHDQCRLSDVQRLRLMLAVHN